MESIVEHNKCTGCTACYNICPKGAISLEESSDGFKYPVINKDKCINCGLCRKVCPVLNSKEIKKEVYAYACYNKDKKIRKKSSSGGMFNLIGSYIIENDGVVFGAKYDADFNVVHDYVNDKKDLYKFMSSKYLQSSLNDNYKKVSIFLKEGIKVLFTGTPCQIEGLYSYLGKDYDNLYTQDIICHGCPSPKVWRKYLNSFKEKVTNVNMRNKDNGWNDFSMKIDFENKSFNLSHNIDKYMYFFLSNFSLRESCYNCSFKNKYRKSDITLADFWGIDNIKPELNDDKGISLVLVNSKKGKELFDEIKDKLIYEEVDFEKSISYNTGMTESCAMTKKRNSFFKDLDKMSFDKLYEKYKPKDKIVFKCKRLLKRILVKLKIMK